jgi:hypothetical protein
MTSEQLKHGAAYMIAHQANGGTKRLLGGRPRRFVTLRQTTISS